VNPVQVAIAVWPWGAYLSEEGLKRGIRAKVSSYARMHVNVQMVRSKCSGQYVNSFLANREAALSGFDEAILLDPQGFVAECTGENLFLVKSGAIVTPGTATILEGITRDALLTIARDLRYEVREAAISRDQLYAADEVFVCGTAAEVVALREIDFRRIGTGVMGPVAARIQKTFHDAVRGRLPEYQAWLSPVGVARPEALSSSS